MTVTPVRRVVIVGGGTAGWMTAAAFSKTLGQACDVHVVESDAIGIIGVGEATIPHIKHFNRGLELDEDEFLRRTQGTFKLGIEFVNWGRLGDRYIHGFGAVGHELDSVPFHHFWLRRFQAGMAKPLAAYSINTVAPQFSKFVRPQPQMAGSPLADLAYAFHFDASLYAGFLREFAQRYGARRTEGRIVRVLKREADGFISGLVMENGQQIDGDFFVDCSGIRALLIEQALDAGFENWQHWLRCDTAIAVPCESAHPLVPMTRSTAHGAGWQWRIPLQHRTGNGHVFSSRYMSEDEATAVLLGNLDGAPMAEPRTIKYVTGRRRSFWVKNCVAVGLSSGFLEPLESTSIHLIQSAIARILQFFPQAGFDAADVNEYNALTTTEYERIRDFLILHYHATERSDSAFWNDCRTMDIPSTLRQRMDLFRSNGRIVRDQADLFAELSWLQVLQGQRVHARGHHPLADLRSDEEVDEFLDDVQGVIRKCVDRMPTQAEFIAAHCAAPRTSA